MYLSSQNKIRLDSSGSSISYGSTVSHRDNTALHNGGDNVYGEVNSVDRTTMVFVLYLLFSNKWLHDTIGVLKAFAI